jgi:hypothetical protein
MLLVESELTFEAIVSWAFIKHEKQVCKQTGSLLGNSTVDKNCFGQFSDTSGI